MWLTISRDSGIMHCYPELQLAVRWLVKPHPFFHWALRLNGHVNSFREPIPHFNPSCW